jgi:transcriptional regulator with XRE-family HTH domain
VPAKRNPKKKKTPVVNAPEVLGGRLRQVRLDRQLSLQEVEGLSGGTIRTPTLSAYELGDSNIPALRLGQLAALYEVSVDDLLRPADSAEPVPAEPQMTATAPGGSFVHIDLTQLERARSKDAEMVAQLVDSIQTRRSTRSSRYFAMRGDDLIAAAALIGRPVDAVLASLQSEGVLRRPRGRPLGRSR